MSYVFLQSKGTPGCSEEREKKKETPSSRPSQRKWYKDIMLVLLSFLQLKLHQKMDPTQHFLCYRFKKWRKPCTWSGGRRRRRRNNTWRWRGWGRKVGWYHRLSADLQLNIRWRATQEVFVVLFFFLLKSLFDFCPSCFVQTTAAYRVVGKREACPGGVQAEGGEGGGCKEKKRGGRGNLLFVCNIGSIQNMTIF